MGMTTRYLNSSRDRGHNDTQFLSTGVTTTKLLSLLNAKFSYKVHFYTKIYNALYWIVWFVGLFQACANQVTYSLWVSDQNMEYGMIKLVSLCKNNKIGFPKYINSLMVVPVD